MKSNYWNCILFKSEKRPSITKEGEKALRSIKQQNFRENTFQKLTNSVGKGVKYSLKNAKVLDEEGKIVKECHILGMLLTLKLIEIKFMSRQSVIVLETRYYLEN